MKHPSKKRVIVTLSVSIGVLLVAFAGYILYYQFFAPPEVKNKYQFTFNTTEAPGWWAANNFWPTLDDYTGDQMTEADLNSVGRNFFQGTNQEDMSGNCFVMYAYYDQPIDVAKKIKEKEASITANDASLSLTKISEETLQIDTPEGTKPYKFHKYDIAGPSSGDFMRGNGIGYVQLQDGYISINAVCKQASQLVDTTPILKSVRFEL